MRHNRQRATGWAAAAVVAAAIATPGAGAAVSAPYLQYAPAMPRVGQKLTVYGRGFCSSAACSAVVLTVDGRWVAKPVRPLYGTFKRTFTITQAMGPHVLQASQRGPNGRRIRFSLRIVFGTSGRE